MFRKNAVEIIITAKDLTDRAFKSVYSGLEGVKKRVFSLQGAVTTLVGGYGAKRLVESFFDVGLSADRMSRGLAAATGSVEAAARAEMFLRQESERLGLVFEDQIKGYKGIAAAARGTALEGEDVREIYLGIVEASTALQLSQEETRGALNAVTQMISKGKVQAEELRGQLGERLPGAFQIAARAMGVTTAQLSDMLDKGQIISEEFLPRFAKQLRDEFADKVKDAANSAQSQINRLQNTWFDLRKTVMESGVTDAFAESIKELNQELKDWTGNNRELIRQKVPEYIKETREALEGIWDIINYDSAIIEWGIVGLAFGGKKGAVLVGGMAHMKAWAENLGKALGMASAGVLDFKEIATANFKELEALVEKGELLLQGPYYRGKIPPRPKNNTGNGETFNSSGRAGEKNSIKKHLEEIAKIRAKALQKIREQEAKLIYEPAPPLLAFEAEADLRKILEDRAKKHAEEEKRLAAERARAYREMYRDMGAEGKKYYAYQVQLLQKQKEQYVKVTGDQELVAEWFSKKLKELNRENLLSYGGFLDGIRVGLDDTAEDLRSWAELGKSLVEDMASGSRNAISDILFDGLTGELKSLSDYWDATWKSMARKATDYVAEFATSALAGLAKKYAGPAISGVASWVKGLFAHEGRWEIKEDEVPIIAQRGEMILPRDVAEPLRRMLERGNIHDMQELVRGMAAPAGAGGLALLGRGLGIGEGVSPLEAVILAAQSALGNPRGTVTGLIENVLGEVIGYKSAPGTWADDVGSIIGSILGTMTLGPGFGSTTGSVLGGTLAYGLADLFNARGPYEALMDALEDAGLGWSGSARTARDVEKARAWDPFESVSYGGGGWDGWGFSPGYESFLIGTGPRGLPRTGLFLGHRGEIVLNPRESELLRRMASGREAAATRPIHITVQVGKEEFEAYIAQVSDGVRVRAERRQMGAGRIY